MGDVLVDEKGEHGGGHHAQQVRRQALNDQPTIKSIVICLLALILSYDTSNHNKQY